MIFIIISPKRAAINLAHWQANQKLSGINAEGKKKKTHITFFLLVHARIDRQQSYRHHQSAGFVNECLQGGSCDRERDQRL